LKNKKSGEKLDGKNNEMKYSNTNIRRQDRLLTEESAKQLLKAGEYAVLSMQAEDGGVYSVPINYVWDGTESIYLHCAKEGRKLRCIDLCNKVSICVVGKTNVISDKFTTEYESIIIDCTAVRNLEEKERVEALHLLLNKYSPNDKEVGKKYVKGALDQTEIIRLDIVDWSGKSKKMG
jgi:uncharacterized protein